jgi:hypothetical protein
MKKNVLLTLFFACTLQFAMAQWEPVQIGNSSAAVSVLQYDILAENGLFVGTDGDGIFHSQDNGNSFTDISGNIGNKNIRSFWGAGTVLFVGTQDGVFFTADLMNYMDATSTGLGSTDVTYFGIGSSAEGSSTYAVGTNGAGIFTSAPDSPLGPWSGANNGLNGDALYINTLGGYYDPEAVTYLMTGTKGGVFFSFDDFGSWQPKNNGLTGPALNVTEVLPFGELPIIGTHAGLLFSPDYGDNWLPLLPDVRINAVKLSSYEDDITFYIFGDQNFFSYDLETYYPINMNGFDGGEITKAAVGGGYIYVVSETPGRSGGSLFRAPVDEVVSLGESFTSSNSLHQLNQNYPNPFSNQTTISYHLNRTTNVELLVMDISGRVVRQLVNTAQESGRHSVTIDAGDLPAGVYFYQLKTADKSVQTKKMIIRK